MTLALPINVVFSFKLDICVYERQYTMFISQKIISRNSFTDQDSSDGILSWLTGNKESRKDVQIADTDKASHSPVFSALLGPGTT